jgi:hypothetical protein
MWTQAQRNPATDATRVERAALAAALVAWSAMANCLGTAIVHQRAAAAAARGGDDGGGGGVGDLSDLYQYPLIIALDVGGAALATACVGRPRAWSGVRVAPNRRGGVRCCRVRCGLNLARCVAA